MVLISVKIMLSNRLLITSLNTEFILVNIILIKNVRKTQRKHLSI